MLTYGSLGNLDAILKMQFSIFFYWLVSLYFYHNAIRGMPRDVADTE